MMSRLTNFFVGLAFVALSLFLPHLASAALFQNSNTACQAIDVLCDSAGAGTCAGTGISESVSCRNRTPGGVFSTGADFTGDGHDYDCAIARNDSNTGTLNDLIVSVLMNTGSTALCSAPGFAQFNSALDYSIKGISGVSTPLSTITTGRLNSTNYSDFALFGGDGEFANAFSDGATGFGVDGTQIEPPLASLVSWVPAGRTQGAIASFSQTEAFGERTAALLDCNGDNRLDEAMVVIETTPTDHYRLNVLLGSTNGLQAISGAGFDTGVAATGGLGLDGTGAALDFANFVEASSGGHNNDVAIVTNQVAATSLVICANDGNCNYSCSTEINLATAHAGVNPRPFSVVAGDFNGDNHQDIAITETFIAGGSTPGIHYYFGNGNGTFAAGGLHMDYAPLGVGGPPPAGIPTAITSGYFNNDTILDVAFAYSETAVLGARVGVVLSSTSSPTGIDTANPITLSFSATDQSAGAVGIDVGDFDGQYGDDIMAVATTVNTRQAYVFMNEQEQVNILIGTVPGNPQGCNPCSTLITDVPLEAHCTIPTDPSASFEYLWEIVNPETCNATITNGTTTNPTFIPHSKGNCVVRVTCRTHGEDFHEDITFNTPGELLTQGGCLANTINPNVHLDATTHWSLTLPIFALVIFVLKRRKNYSRIFSFLMVGVLLGGFFSASAHATSFSTNFFKPVVDDSDYFTVYNSSTNKRNHYHLGFYVDYAYHPYEVGNPSFDRQTGITDNLITGNFLGSFGLFDWLSVGGRIPIYLYNNINAPILSRPSEANFNLGDLELNFKLRLIDAKTHKYGLAFLPYMVFPTANDPSSDFVGNGTMAGGGKFIFDFQPSEKFSLAFNVGYEARGNFIDISGQKIDDHLTMGLGVAYNVMRNKLKIIGETQMETVVSDFFHRRTTPAEARVGVRYAINRSMDINAGGGLGYTNGISSPDFRVFTGFTYTRRPIAKVTLKEAPPDEFQIGDELTLQDKIYFDFDKAKIRDISKPTLDKVAALLKAHPELTKLRVEGHTCNLGTDAYNLRLSQRRANAVVDYLVSQGVDRSRLRAVGYGEAKPLVPNTDEPHREQNRRVQIFIEAKAQ